MRTRPVLPLRDDIDFRGLLFIRRDEWQRGISKRSLDLVTQLRIEADKPIGPIGNLYNVGYNGWGDITYPGMVKFFNVAYSSNFCVVGQTGK